MDENCETHDMKSRRLNSKHDACVGVANIGDLPQAILEYILSFLPMKDAIKTSVLSRKWRYLWTSIPKLTFEELSYSSRELFMDYIERVLLLHAHSSIEYFSLKCNVLDNASQVNAWVSNVVRCNVEFCEITLSKLCGTFVLSPALFTSGTLRNLHLTIPTLTLPSQIHLPSLKNLSLSEVEFPNECLTQQLFSSPVLEYLYIQHCSWVNLRAITILAPKLKFLYISESYWSTSEHCCQVRIGECNLESFAYSGPLSNEYSMFNLSVAEAVISTHQTKVQLQPEVVHRLYKIMHGICAARELKLYQMTIQLLEAGARFNFQGHLPIFKFLNSLTIGRGDVKSEVLGQLLQCTPHLQTLELSEGVRQSSEIGGEIFDCVPSCFFSSLKKIRIDVLFLDAEEMHVLKTILKHARVLQEFVILINSGRQCNVEWVELFRDLVECPRGSEKCKIILESIFLEEDMQFNGGAILFVALKYPWI